MPWGSSKQNQEFKEIQVAKACYALLSSCLSISVLLSWVAKLYPNDVYLENKVRIQNETKSQNKNKVLTTMDVSNCQSNFQMNLLQRTPKT